MAHTPALVPSDPVTPLKAQSFDTLLSKFSLTEKYPTLVEFISNGFPIGPMPPVTETIIQQNHISSADDIAIVHDNFMEEVKLKRMIGPMSIKQAQWALSSCFRTSPVGLVPKANSPGKFRVIRDLSYCGSAGHSVNDLIPADRPTRWVAASEFACQVSKIFASLSNLLRTSWMRFLTLVRQTLFRRGAFWR